MAKRDSLGSFVRKMAKLLKGKGNEQIGLREVEHRSLGAGVEGRSKRDNGYWARALLAFISHSLGLTAQATILSALRAFGGSSAPTSDRPTEVIVVMPRL
jgi:hypothetical protein